MISKNVIHDIAYMMKPQNLSVNDGEGIRTVLFLSGCPLRCQWCANPEGFTIAPKKGFVGKYSIHDIMKLIEKQKVFFRQSGGGVTFSGGEAALQVEFLRNLVNQLYDRGIDMALETSGYFDFEELEDVLQKMSQIFVDIKVIDESKHVYYTGKSNTVILNNIKKMDTVDADLIVRVPVIVGVNDDDENIRRTAMFINTHLTNPKVELLPYHELGQYKYDLLGLEESKQEFSTPCEIRMRTIKDIFQEEGIELVSYL